MHSALRPAVLAAALIVFASAAGATERLCHIVAMTGDAADLGDLRGEFEPLVLAPLPPRAVIATGARTRVEILCDDGLTVTIGADTRVDLGALSGPAGAERSIVLRLIEGVIGVIAPNATWLSLDVRTPLAIASARSTEWIVAHSADGTAVFVAEGAVAVSGETGAEVEDEVLLAEGEGVDVAADGPGPVKTWGAARVAAAKARLGFSWR